MITISDHKLAWVAWFEEVQGCLVAELTEESAGAARDHVVWTQRNRWRPAVWAGARAPQDADGRLHGGRPPVRSGSGAPVRPFRHLRVAWRLLRIRSHGSPITDRFGIGPRRVRLLHGGGRSAPADRGSNDPGGLDTHQGRHRSRQSLKNIERDVIGSLEAPLRRSASSWAR